MFCFDIVFKFSVIEKEATVNHDLNSKQLEAGKEAVKE